MDEQKPRKNCKSLFKSVQEGQKRIELYGGLVVVKAHSDRVIYDILDKERPGVYKMKFNCLPHGYFNGSHYPEWHTVIMN